MLAYAARPGGDRARAALREATDIFDELGDHSGAAWSLNQQGDIAREQDDLSAAKGLYVRALSVFRAAGDRWGAGRSLADLAAIDCVEGNYQAAHAAYHEALKIFVELGHRRGIARTLEGFACLALAEGQAVRALKLAAAAANLRRAIGAFLPQAEQSKLHEILRPAWQLLSEEEGTSAWSEGSAMSMEKAIHYSLERPESAILS